MQQAWVTLQELGAIGPEGELTALGRQMVSSTKTQPTLSLMQSKAILPLDLRLGKMLIIGTLFGCLSPVLSIAACLTSKSLFVSPLEKRDEANA